MTTWPLTTPRLALRPFETDDFEAIWSYRSLPDVHLWLGGSLDRDEVRERFVVQDDDMEAKRTIGVLGWTMRPDVGGRGLATEAVRELLRHAFDDLSLRREAHHVRDSLHRTRGWQDEYVYALLADEWRERQAAPNDDASMTKR
jgi:RimJ/RimL family protein N-acetyltransferase